MRRPNSDNPVMTALPMKRLFGPWPFGRFNARLRRVRGSSLKAAVRMVLVSWAVCAAPWKLPMKRSPSPRPSPPVGGEGVRRTGEGDCIPFEVTLRDQRIVGASREPGRDGWASQAPPSVAPQRTFTSRNADHSVPDFTLRSNEQFQGRGGTRPYQSKIARP